MRIVQVSPYSWDAPGGVQAHVRQLAEHLTAAGHEVHVLAPGKPPYRRGGVRIVGRAMPVRANGSVARICFSPQSSRAVERALREIRPDVIHVHEPLSPSTAMFAVLHANAPVVATFHSNVPREPMQGLLFKLGVPFVRPVWERIDRHIAVSQAARDSVVARLGEAPFTIVPNGSDILRFATAAAAELPDGRYMLFVGRLEPRKGFPVAVAAFEMLARRFSDLNFLVVGGGSDKSAIDELPAAIGRRVKMLGVVHNDRLPAYYRRADCFVSPATGSESFGIVLVEAMAAGLPVVASDIPGYREVVRQGREGILVAPSDPEALADAVALILEDRALARSLGDRGRRRARDFSWDVVAQQLEAVYREATRARRRKPRGVVPRHRIPAEPLADVRVATPDPGRPRRGFTDQGLEAG